MDKDDKRFDKYVGQKIKDRRKQLGMTQAELSDILGLSYQQVQRYESGENTVAMPRLMEIAGILNARLDYFYQDAPLPPREETGREVIARKTGRTLNVLLIEDSPDDELLFRKAVANSNVPADIYVVQDSEKALDFIKARRGAEPPDLVVLDINMPRLNGLALLRQLKDNPKTRPLSVIMLTNSVRRKDMLESYAQGANGFIQKNSNLNEFYEDIKRTLQYWSQTVVLPGAA
ncbi:MAG: response regulator [Alphaproteobacteria bacterium]|nr:response regulator [Alphaproteobacteria bacterium]